MLKVSKQEVSCRTFPNSPGHKLEVNEINVLQFCRHIILLSPNNLSLLCMSQNSKEAIFTLFTLSLMLSFRSVLSSVKTHMITKKSMTNLKITKCLFLKHKYFDTLKTYLGTLHIDQLMFLQK